MVRGCDTFNGFMYETEEGGTCPAQKAGFQALTAHQFPLVLFLALPSLPPV